MDSQTNQQTNKPEQKHNLIYGGNNTIYPKTHRLTTVTQKIQKCVNKCN